MTNKKKAGRLAKDANPFQVVNNVELKGNRITNPLTEKLAEAIMKLPVRNKMTSVFVPPSIASSRNDAQNLILGARRFAKEKHPDYVFSCKFSYENNDKYGKYLGANIWRIN